MTPDDWNDPANYVLGMLIRWARPPTSWTSGAACPLGEAVLLLVNGALTDKTQPNQVGLQRSSATSSRPVSR